MNTTITWQEHSADELKYEKMVTDENYVVTVTDINNDYGNGFIMKKAPDLSLIHISEPTRPY